MYTSSVVRHVRNTGILSLNQSEELKDINDSLIEREEQRSSSAKVKKVAVVTHN